MDRLEVRRDCKPRPRAEWSQAPSSDGLILGEVELTVAEQDSEALEVVLEIEETSVTKLESAPEASGTPPRRRSPKAPQQEPSPEPTSGARAASQERVPPPRLKPPGDPLWHRRGAALETLPKPAARAAAADIRRITGDRLNLRRSR